MQRSLIILFFFPLLLHAQTETKSFPVDTTFTVWSAWQKIKNDFPAAVPVKPFEDSKIAGLWNREYYALGNRKLHADLFFPKQNTGKGFPAVILIHGGGWASGNKSHLVPLAQKLASKGFFAATAEYRLSPEAKYPAAITDLKTLVKWLKANARTFHIDTTKIAVLGCSSGATLATFLGTTNNHPLFRSHPFPGKITDRVHAVINIDGIVDFTDPAESGKDSDPQKPSAGARWFGFTSFQNPEIWIEASPVSYVNEYTPPTLFINSSIPRFHAGRDAFTKVLSKNQICSEIHTIENTPHPFWLFYPWFDEVQHVVNEFLNKVL